MTVRLRWAGAALTLCTAIVFGACSQADGAPRDNQENRTSALAVAAPPAQLADTTLDRLVAEIQPAVERSAGIRAIRPLNVAATDEARLRAYLENQIGTQLTEDEASAITRAYARLGLVPATLDLQALFLALLEEQVVGYYDPVSDTLFVHERVTVEQLEPVLAHELVHALQDQQVALDSLAASLQEKNDASTAYQAAVEGHATFAMMEWQFSAMTGAQSDLTQLPDLGPTMSNIDLSAFGDIGPVDVLVGAPAVIREGLLFPYVGGLVFLQRLWTRRPERPLPFGDNLPRSTEQVLHVERWLAGDEPTQMAFSSETPGWSVVYSRDLGELETRVFLEEHLGDRERAESAAMGWDGDVLRLLESPDGEALVWVSAWDSEAEADEFAEAVLDAYDQRYRGGERRPEIARVERSGRPLVRIVDVPPGIELPADAAAVRVSGGEGL